MSKDNRPFVVLALPRSRTTWLARFLTYGPWICGHDQLQYVRSFEDVKAWFAQPNIGTAETAGAYYWRLMQKLVPEAKVLVVRRDVREVVDSLVKAGLDLPKPMILAQMQKLDKKLDQVVRRVPGVLEVEFEDLRDEGTCAKAFEHCLETSHDHEHWLGLERQNVQINFQAQLRYVHANVGELARMASIARETMLKDLAVVKRKQSSLVIEEETLDDLNDDGQEMMRRHCACIGEFPDNWINKNIPLMREMNKIGALRIVLARCNGKVFGYLGAIVSPTMEAGNRLVAETRMFYAAEEFPGLGLRMQREMMRILKASGVSEVYMRAGVRGDGARLGTLYKRLGATDFGQMYRLELKD